MERDTATHTEIADAMNFNSHAHVERDNGKGEDFRKNYISTHTLTWSVTWFGGIDYVLCKNFNSHAHVERDYKVNDFTITTSISTHTLTWSVTRSAVEVGAVSEFQLTRST